MTSFRATFQIGANLPERYETKVRHTQSVVEGSALAVPSCFQDPTCAAADPAGVRLTALVGLSRNGNHNFGFSIQPSDPPAGSWPQYTFHMPPGTYTLSVPKLAGGTWDASCPAPVLSEVPTGQGTGVTSATPVLGVLTDSRSKLRPPRR